MRNGNRIRNFLLGAGAAMALTALVPLGFAEGKTAKAKPYPLTTCVVTDGTLGEMGAPHVFTYQGREIKLCCQGCLKTFNKEPAKYVKKLEAAEKGGKKP